MMRYRCGCGALNAVGLLRCPQPGCGRLSPRFAAPAAAAAAAAPVPAARPAPQRRTAGRARR